jgi:hypothetical protein
MMMVVLGGPPGHHDDDEVVDFDEWMHDMATLLLLVFVFSRMFGGDSFVDTFLEFERVFRALFVYRIIDY